MLNMCERLVTAVKDDVNINKYLIAVDITWIDCLAPEIWIFILRFKNVAMWVECYWYLQVPIPDYYAIETLLRAEEFSSWMINSINAF